jgi:hypothetical protein
MRAFSASRKREGTLDAAACIGGAAHGTKTLKDVLGDAPWQSLVKTPEELDRVAEVLSFRKDVKNIRTGLNELGLDSVIVQSLLDAAIKGYLGPGLPQHHPRIARGLGVFGCVRTRGLRPCGSAHHFA